MKKIILLLVIFITTYSFSQTQTRDVVYLKNGSIIKGQIKEMNPSESLKIETGDGSLFVYKMTEILKMEKETFAGSQMNNNKTQSVVSINILSDYFKRYFSQTNRRALKFIDVSKKNGVKREVNGQKIYAIEYELLLEPIQDIFVSDMMSIHTDGFSKTFGYMTKQPQGWDSYMNSDTKKISQGQRIIANGTINLEETDNGWRVSNFSNRNYKSVSSNYVSANMKVQQQKRAKELESAGDYKKADVADLTLKPKYLNATNVPLFESSDNKISVKKLRSGCNNCRNDNIMSIENSVNKAFSNSNRYNTIQESDFKMSTNTAKFTIYVNNISYKHRGVSKSGTNKGFSCDIRYSISLRAKFTTPQELTFKDIKSSTATSSAWKIYSNKESAFTGALLQLESQIKKTIFKYEPLSLKVKSFELDKKGNPEYIILEKTGNIFNTKKIEFYILEKTSLSIKNGKFSIGENLGKASYKKSDFPNVIKLKIKKSKMKKALKNYIGKENELVGFSK